LGGKSLVGIILPKELLGGNWRFLGPLFLKRLVGNLGGRFKTRLGNKLG